MKMDIQVLREETPGSEKVIHFNNAGSSLMPRPVYEAVKSYLEEEYMQGGYEIARLHHQALEDTYAFTAQLIGAQKEEIALLESATVAWDRAFYSIPWQEGDRILVGKTAYASNYLAYLQVARRKGIMVDVVPNDDQGQVDVEALRQMLDEKVKLIGITHIPTNSGLVNPAEEIGKVAKEAGCIYLLDACQSFGQYPIDVQKIGCDILSATGRKYLRGPRGTGFLYMRSALANEIEPIFLDLHSAEWVEPQSYRIRSGARRFESWESNLANRLGFSQAVQYAMDLGMDQIWDRLQYLGNHFREILASIPKVHGRDIGAVLGGIVTFNVEGQDSDDIQKALFAQGINVSVSPRGATLLDMQERGLKSVVRASIHYYNTEEEIHRFAEVLEKITK